VQEKTFEKEILLQEKAEILGNIRKLDSKGF
jgi:hypothetical protein